MFEFNLDPGQYQQSLPVTPFELLAHVQPGPPTWSENNPAKNGKSRVYLNCLLWPEPSLSQTSRYLFERPPACHLPTPGVPLPSALDVPASGRGQPQFPNTSAGLLGSLSQCSLKLMHGAQTALILVLVLAGSVSTFGGLYFVMSPDANSCIASLHRWPMVDN